MTKIQQLVIDSKNNSRQLFDVTKRLLEKPSTTNLMETEDPAGLANSFASFFADKVEKIRSDITSDRSMCVNGDKSLEFDNLFQGSSVKYFRPPDVSEVISVIRKSPSKCCSLDPLPTWLVKECLSSLSSPITEIIQTSMQTGVVPPEFKQALITPILKKPTLDSEDLKNYRPISNLPFLSKVMERIVLTRIQEHLRQHSIIEEFQSAYKSKHSTETALVRVHNDILRSMDNQDVVLLTLLDLSAAFDTVDHTILLSRLQHSIGLQGVALKWMKSYLKGRSMRVKINEALSGTRDVSCGVPQGSVLGPVLFSLYISPLGNIIRQHGLSFHGYADDNQLYISTKPVCVDDARIRLEHCMMDIRQWMAHNFLKLNDQKTEYIIIGTRQQIAKAPETPITIGTSYVAPSTSVRNLGVVFDNTLSAESQALATARTANFHIRNIGKIRGFLDVGTTKLLMNSYVLSRLDYCNALLHSTGSINHLQKVQNTAARIVSRTRKSEHITPVLKNLNWLPIKQRIKFKIIVLTYNALHHPDAPQYLKSLISRYQPTRQLRSAEDNLLSVPATKTRSAERAFTVVAPTLWNCLPTSIKNAANCQTFKRLLRDYLFREAFALTT